MPGMRTLVFSGAGILRRSHDHQLRGHNGCRRGDISLVVAVSGFHEAVDQFKNSLVDGLRHRSLLIVDAARLQFLARYRFLDQAQTAGHFLDRKILAASYQPGGNADDRPAEHQPRRIDPETQ